MDPMLLKNKFRGTMLGVLVGDCLGGPCEGLKVMSARRKEPVMDYTDDSAMTRSLAESLIEKQDLDIVDVARRFTECYHKELLRSHRYGAGTVTVSFFTKKLI
ncbi:PREDICTED: poly(ADP-ribose) glycohydrolase ARH3-like isoform X2 [Vollenhovia emeryi]|uniref:poly(ADP-ribose) glycohydrolase ARH3-like isoform X2 n=1 Tax=Vollenhovia emeryi TaxID=411798 RepID=UPI0005F48392|nr:PREDICTED: poly(ADP-ribose) glycohydrolase ARH3-like isoform X2 [Vollenhovia emeryi]